MNLQYIHDHITCTEWGNFDKDRKRTYCFELPEYYIIETELMKMITDVDYRPIVSIVVGVANCHPEDQYVKSIGRELAFANRELINWNIRNV